jgi:hypothetical protein
LWLLGYLCHGGVLFSGLAAAPFLVAALVSAGRKGRSTRWLARVVPVGGLVVGPMVMLAGPWLAYQRFYQPPGDRLMKMHLAGVDDPGDTRSVLATIVDQYKAVGVRAAFRARIENVKSVLGVGAGVLNWHPFDAQAIREWRDNEFFSLRCALTVAALFAIVIVTLMIQARMSRAAPMDRRRVHALLWSLLTVGVWAAFMFVPGAAVVHQGSLAAVVALFALPAVIVAATRPRLFVGIAAFQVLLFTTTWLGYNPREEAPPMSLVAAGLFAVSTAALLYLIGRVWRSTPVPFGQPSTDVSFDEIVGPGGRATFTQTWPGRRVGAARGSTRSGPLAAWTPTAVPHRSRDGGSSPPPRD